MKILLGENDMKISIPKAETGTNGIFPFNYTDIMKKRS